MTGLLMLHMCTWQDSVEKPGAGGMKASDSAFRLPKEIKKGGNDTMTSKKGIALLLAVMMTLALTATAFAADTTTLRFSWWGGEARHQATLEALEAYAKVNPAVVVEPEYQSYDGYEEKIATQIAGSTQPDLIQVIFSRMVEWGSTNDIFVNLEEQDILDVSLWDEGFRKAYGYVGDQLFGLATDVNAYAIMINKNVTDRLGLEIPEAFTWDSFIDFGRQINEKDANCYLLSADKDSLNLLMRSYIRQKTGVWYVADDYTVLENEAAYVEAFQLIRRLYDEKVLEPIEENYPYWGNLQQDPKWINEEVAAMYCAASSLAGVKQENMQMVPVLIPQDEGSLASGVITQPSQLFVISKGERQEETLKLLSYLYTTEEGATILADSRGVPPTQFQRDLLAEKNLLDAAVAQAVNMAVPVSDEPAPTLSENSQIYEVCQSTIEQICYNAISPEDAAKQIIAGCQTVLAELQN